MCDCGGGGGRRSRGPPPAFPNAFLKSERAERKAGGGVKGADGAARQDK